MLTVQDLLGPMLIRLQQLLIDNPQFKEGDDYNVLTNELQLLSSVFLLLDNPEPGNIIVRTALTWLQSNLIPCSHQCKTCGLFWIISWITSLLMTILWR